MSRAIVAIVFVTVMIMVHWASTRIVLNETPSMAMGLYWIISTSAIHRGDVVLACAPKRFGQWGRSVRILKDGPCDGVEAVLKRAVAIAGDRVRIDRDGVFVNGRHLASSKRDVLLDDGARCGRLAPVAFAPDVDRVLLNGEVELLGDNRDRSYDGRYWGATNRVLGKAVKMVAL
jgi:conjugative transfer signal peptidase TraF